MNRHEKLTDNISYLADDPIRPIRVKGAPDGKDLDALRRLESQDVQALSREKEQERDRASWDQPMKLLAIIASALSMMVVAHVAFTTFLGNDPRVQPRLSLMETIRNYQEMVWFVAGFALMLVVPATAISMRAVVVMRRASLWVEACERIAAEQEEAMIQRKSRWFPELLERFKIHSSK